MQIEQQENPPEDTTKSLPIKRLQKTYKDTIKSVDVTPEDSRRNDGNGATPEEKIQDFQ